jgi:hypothetical protein
LIAAVIALKTPGALQTRVGIATGLVVVGDLTVSILVMFGAIRAETVLMTDLACAVRCECTTKQAAYSEQCMSPLLALRASRPAREVRFRHIADM